MRSIRHLAAALAAVLALGALPALAHGPDRHDGRGGDRRYEERGRGHGHWGHRQPPRQVIVVERGYRRPPPRVIYVEPAPVYQRPQINIVLPLRF